MSAAQIHEQRLSSDGRNPPKEIRLRRFRKQETPMIQYYAFFWKKFESVIIETIKSKLPHLDSFWIQERNFDQKKSIRSIEGKDSSDFSLQEFGLNYKIKINQHYDFGIYSDMSAIRKLMKPYLSSRKKLLNLSLISSLNTVFLPFPVVP